MKRILILMLAMLSVLSLSGCAKAENIKTELAEETAYTLDFEGLNRPKTHTLALQEGDSLRVEITQTSGDIGLTVARADGYEIYSGNKLQTFAFTLNISQAGAYTLTVTGKNADGAVHIYVIE